jgi:hypothetical protein
MPNKATQFKKMEDVYIYIYMLIFVSTMQFLTLIHSFIVTFLFFFKYFEGKLHRLEQDNPIKIHIKTKKYK